MRFIPTRFHGTLDYVVGLLLIASPWLLGFDEIEAATWTAVIAGVVVLMQAAITDFEVGLIRKMPMGTHLMMDALLGILLAASPWLFGFAEEVYTPHLIFGLYLVLASLTTHRVPSRSYGTSHTQHGNVR
jgi:ammonia channel protein AmtB